MSISKITLNTLSKNKEFSNIILISIASFSSLFGTSAYNFAIGLYVLKLTGSGLSFATTQVLGIISVVLFNPIAGVLADRLDKKLLAILMDLLNSTILISLYLATIRYSLNLPMIYISTFLINVFTTIYGISLEAAKPNLVSEKRLITMNSISKVLDASSSIMGPVIGGLVFAFLNIRFFIIINGISFAVSAMLQFFMDFKFNCIINSKNKEKVKLVADIKEGLTYMLAKKDILNMFTVFIALNFFIGLSITVPMPYILNNVLKLSSKAFGIIEAAFPVGMILGALFIKRLMRKYSYGELIKLTSLLLSACMAAIGLSVLLSYQVKMEAFFLIYFIFIMIVAGIAISSIDIPIFYILQQTIPEEYRGRVLSIGISVAKIILPIALILAGVLTNLIPSYVLPIISGAGLCVFTLFFFKLDFSSNP
jgi:MFS family permease